MRAKIKPVNDMAVADEHLNIITSKNQNADIDRLSRHTTGACRRREWADYESNNGMAAMGNTTGDRTET